MINKNIVISGASIGFRNFSGKEGKFNPAGRRNFCLFIDNKFANELLNDGWNVRFLEPKDKQDTPQGYLQVSVSYDNMPPKIVMVSSKGKTICQEDTVGILDWAEIQNVDLVIKPYNWEVNGKKGVKAYIKNMYVVLAEDEFASKYEDVPDSGSDAIGGCGNCNECDGNCKHEH